MKIKSTRIRMVPFLMLFYSLGGNRLAWASDSGVFDNVFLVWPTLQCTLADTDENVAFVVNPSNDVKKGDSFSIVMSTENIITGTWDRLLGPDECPPLKFMDASVGLIHVAHSIPIDNSNKAYLGFKGSLTRDQIVSVVKSEPSGSLKDALSKWIPSDHKLFQPEVFEITNPRTGKKYVIVAIEHANMDQYRTGGDKVLVQESFIWSKNKLEPTPGLKLTDVIAATDIDKNGRIEVLLHNSQGYSGQYGLWTFDGQQFGRCLRVLYSWMD